jgi:hypothetical protein
MPKGLARIHLEGGVRLLLSRDPDLNSVILVLSPRPATKSTADSFAKFPSAHDVWRAVQWH